jgi:arylsulfatase A-like enzyme
MNFVVFIFDTLRFDHLGCNRRRPIRTPNFDAFAEIATNFERCYTGSYPSQPHRCDCATGRFVFPFYGWQAMPEDEIHLVELLGESGYRTHLIADRELPFDLGLVRGFQSSQQLKDTIDPALVEQTPWPCNPKKSRIPEQLRRQWAVRTHVYKEEEDWPQPRVMEAASEFVSAAGDEPFFLWTESWRVHETWVDPQAYVDAYDPGYEGEIVALPSYSPDVDYLTPEELNHMRALYAASVTFTDKWFGTFMATLEKRGLLENTCVIVSSDHGYAIGDHNRTGKHAVASPRQEPWPLYEECTHVPLLVHAPGQTKSACSTHLVQHADLMPTVFDLVGLDTPGTVKGRSWRPLMERGDAAVGADWRDIAVTSSIVRPYPETGSTRTTVTTPEWTLILPTDRRAPELYNLAIDPGQTYDAFPQHRDVADDILAKFRRLLGELNADPDLIESWRAPW